MFAVVSFELRLPPALVRPIVTPVVMRVLRQDAVVLRKQTETVRRFGGELLDPHICRLLREAETAGLAAGHESGMAVIEPVVRFLA